MATKQQRDLLIKNIRKIFDPICNKTSLPPTALNHIYKLIEDCTVDKSKISLTAKYVDIYIKQNYRGNGTNASLWDKVIRKIMATL